MTKVISIAVGDRVKIEGVGEVELVVVTPEQPKEERHPLLGKYVRCVKQSNCGDYVENKWYPIVKANRKLLWVKDEKESFAWSNDLKVPFDFSNPCDFDPNMPEAINPKFKVGDEVVVVDRGETCSTYKEAYWFFGFQNKSCNEAFNSNAKAKIFGVCKHGVMANTIYALRDEQGNECVIGEEGIILAGIDKEEWLAASSRLFDSWMKISCGFLLNKNRNYYSVFYDSDLKSIEYTFYRTTLEFPFSFKTKTQIKKFITENEKDLLTYFHQS